MAVHDLVSRLSARNDVNLDACLAVQRMAEVRAHVRAARDADREGDLAFVVQECGVALDILREARNRWKDHQQALEPATVAVLRALFHIGQGNVLRQKAICHSINYEDDRANYLYNFATAQYEHAMSELGHSASS